MERLNCWEFRKCGRELGGKNEKELGICPASTYLSLEGIHDGIASGRACWVVAGTMCKDGVSGTLAEKLGDCRACEFYEMVMTEEGDGFMPTVELLRLVDRRARLL
ncbi:two-CW domain-containing protein [Nitrospirota bacterium]